LLEEKEAAVGGPCRKHYQIVRLPSGSSKLLTDPSRETHHGLPTELEIVNQVFIQS